MKNKKESSTDHLTDLDNDKIDWSNKDSEYWKSVLTPLQYKVTQEAATEAPGTGLYELTTDEGEYFCSCCGELLFKSDSKFNSGCGWPSFTEVAVKGNINYQEDHSLGRVRIEVTCSKCNAHLGHVFDDGPVPTGKRYCINSVCLSFKKSK